ncbi:phospholipase D family protein [Flavobacterium filum]|uniref:phospholipase D family protein n=1 Tax=Flavobacterium TaxID=237 RepID=UPI0023F042E1|nr:phospholipase D family protein [Flavobacterium filum]
MAKFLTGNKLNTKIEKIFENAENSIILISPYIKLHDRYISVLQTKKDNPKLDITIVFGKNENDLSKSMKEEDFNFFKDFPNIEIRYEKRLHAKYYANEESAILTSMNLYSFSQDNNIEAGVLFTTVDKVDSEAWEYFNRVIDQSELLFQRNAIFKKANFGLTSKYKESKTEVDKLSEFFAGKSKSVYKERYITKSAEVKKIIISTNESVPLGYCIRTGIRIPFNPKQPMSADAFTSWSQYKNQDYAEKFCHFSGEASHGETTFAKPILRKHWKAAKEVFDL